jgi:hypothetical protein
MTGPERWVLLNTSLQIKVFHNNEGLTIPSLIHPQVQQRNLGVSGRIFAIETIRNRSGKGSHLKLKVNFLPEIIQLSKEVRNLKNLGFRVPLAIVNKAHQVKSSFADCADSDMEALFLRCLLLFKYYYIPLVISTPFKC